MSSLFAVYSENLPLVTQPESEFLDFFAFDLKAMPTGADDALKVLTAENKLFDAIEGRIFDPTLIQLEGASVVYGRLCVSLLFEGVEPFRILFYRSSGKNYARTYKCAGEWYAVLGFADSGWFVKTQKLVEACRGGNLFLCSLSSFLQVSRLVVRA